MPFIFFYFDPANVLLSLQISDFGRMKKTNDQAYPPLYTGSTTEKRLPSPCLELSAIPSPQVLYDSLADRQPQTGPLAEFILLEKTAEHLLLLLLR